MSFPRPPFPDSCADGREASPARSLRGLLRSPCSVLLLGVFATLSGSAPARAQMDPELSLTPEIVVTQSADSDGVVLGDREESNSIFEVRPGVGWRLATTSTAFSGRVGMRSRASSAGSDLDALDRTASFGVRHELTPRFSASLSGSMRTRDGEDPIVADQESEEEGQTADVRLGRPDVQDLRMQLGFGFRLDPMSQLSVSLTSFARDFDGREAVRNANRDSEARSWRVSLGRRLSPRDQLDLSLLRRDVDFDGEPAADFARAGQSDVQTSLIASWRRQLSPLWSGSLNLGIRRLEGRGGEISGLVSPLGNGSRDMDSTGFVGGLRLSRQTPWSQVELGYARETRPSGGVGTSLDIDSLTLGYRLDLLRNVSLRLGASYQRAQSASDFVFTTLQPVLVTSDGALVVDQNGDPIGLGCRSGSGAFPGRVGSTPVCAFRSGSQVDSDLVRLSAGLRWRVTPGLTAFVSVDMRDQELDGRFGTRDRSNTRLQVGFRYAYTLDLL